MSRPVRSRWLMNGNRKPLAQVRIVGLNLQGKPQKTTGSFFLFSSPAKELQTTIFVFQFSIGSYRWTISKSFDEMKEFHNMILTDSTLRSGREYFTLPFPAGKDGEVDTMILVERREMIEAIFKEILGVLDFEVYRPLGDFMDAFPHIDSLVKTVRTISNKMRSVLAKQRLNYRLFRFYSQELLNFVYTMEAGIEVYNIDEQGEPEPFMLWLDICDEPALSRICLAPKNIFALPKQYEDERLANGIFLSDIAEVRKGAASHAFRMYPFSHHFFRPELCVCIVGSERTLSVQFIQELLPETPAPVTEQWMMSPAVASIANAGTEGSRSASPMPPSFQKSDSAYPQTPIKKDTRKMLVDRAYFIDMLTLLSIQSLPSTELKLRHRKFRRCCPHSSVKVYPNHILTKRIRDNAEKLMKLLIAGIEVDEETFSPYLGFRIYQKNLQYDAVNRKLLIHSIQSRATSPMMMTDSQLSSLNPSEETLPIVSTTIDGRAISPVGRSLSGDARSELQHIIEVENEDEDEDSSEEILENGKERVELATKKNKKHTSGKETELNNEEDDDDDHEEEGREGVGEDGERTSSSSQSSMSQRNTMESLHTFEFANNPPALSNPASLLPLVSSTSTEFSPLPPNLLDPITTNTNIDLSHLKFELTTLNRSIDIDDICEIRPGKVSPLIDGSNTLENDALYVSIIASESILVLPVPSLVVRNNLIKRFQAFMLVHRNYTALDTDTPMVFRKKAATPSPRLSQRVATSTLPSIPAGSVLTFNSPPQAMKKATKRGQKKGTTSSSSSHRPPAYPVTHSMASNPSNGSGLMTPTSGTVTPSSTTSSSRRRRSAPSAALTAQAAQVHNHHVYAHTKLTRSVSIVRRSSTSSRGPSSINESFHTATGAGASRTTSVDF